LQKRLGESPPEVEENQIRRGPGEEVARAPSAAGERRWQWLGTLGREERNCPKGSLTPPFYTQPASRPDIVANVFPDYPAPLDILPMGVDILAWNTRKQFHSNFQ
jgi:hypothetical protein